MARVSLPLSVFCLLIACSVALSDPVNTGRPAGREIQDKASQTSFVHKYVAAYQYGDGKWVRFTPADMHGVLWKDLENGAVLGRLELGKTGAETGLAPGTYDVFVKKVNSRWMVFFESNGLIDKDSVNVQYHPNVNTGTPQILNNGKCIDFSRFQFCF